MVVKKKSTKGSLAKPRKTAGKVAKTAKKPIKAVKKTAAKKASKIVKKTVATKTKATGRGRPKKEFKLKHKRILDKTTPSIVVHEMPKSHNINKSNTARDRSILYLFVFSVILFTFSLGISFLKKDKTKELENIEEINPIQIEETTEKIAENEISIVGLENFYIAINSKNFPEALEQLDSYLKKTSTIKTYFSSTRLTRFLDNLKDGKIHVDNIQGEIIDEYTANVTYTISYTLLDENKYEEQWTASIVKKDGEEGKIAAIKCETSGCSRMPFFNPTKYNIK